MEQNSENEIIQSSNITDDSSLGEIRVSNEVIANVAVKACEGVEGFSGFAENIVDGISKMLQGELTEGVIIQNSSGADENEEGQIEVELSVILKYDYNVQTVCAELQRTVKEKIETLTGVAVYKVNINVQGINFK